MNKNKYFLVLGLFTCLSVFADGLKELLHALESKDEDTRQASIELLQGMDVKDTAELKQLAAFLKDPSIPEDSFRVVLKTCIEGVRPNDELILLPVAQILSQDNMPNDRKLAIVKRFKIKKITNKKVHKEIQKHLFTPQLTTVIVDLMKFKSAPAPDFKVLHQGLGVLVTNSDVEIQNAFLDLLEHCTDHISFHYALVFLALNPPDKVAALASENFVKNPQEEYIRRANQRLLAMDQMNEYMRFIQLVSTAKVDTQFNLSPEQRSRLANLETKIGLGNVAELRHQAGERHAAICALQVAYATSPKRGYLAGMDRIEDALTRDDKNSGDGN